MPSRQWVVALVCSVLLACGSSSSGALTRTVPDDSVEWPESKQIILGTFERGRDTTFTISYTNLGVRPIRLDNIRSSCGCTVPAWQRSPLVSGATSEFDVEYSCTKSGNQEHQLQVWFDRFDAPYIITIKAYCETKD